MYLKWLCLFLFSSGMLFSQNPQNTDFSLGAQYYYGVLLRHNKNIAHLVREQPQGIILSYNRKTFGDSYWQQAYGYPDWGVSFIYQNFGYEVLGENYGVYGHFNFYFLNRKLKFRVAEGIAYNTNPFDLEDNFKNVAYGSSLMASTYFLLQYEEAQILKDVGLQVGLSFVHHSNGSVKAPNTGTNVFGLTLGMSYNPTSKDSLSYQKREVSQDFSEPIKINLELRGGINESDYFNLGRHPFYVVSAYADKRLNYKSTLQFGVEYFVSEFLKEEIEYVLASFPNRLDGPKDHKRVGVMLGHEFSIGKLGLPTQLGYYVYWPYEYESRVYARIGVKYYVTSKLFAGVYVKSHAANAEHIAFGGGIRL